MSSMLPVPDKLCLSAEQRSTNWESFQQKWNNYEVASGLSEKTEAVRLATLLTIIGDEALLVYNTFKWGRDTPTVSAVLTKFTEYCMPKTSEIYNRYILMSRKQHQNEKIDDYVITLENLASKCNYGSLKDSIVRDVFVLGIGDVRTRESLLKESEIDLSKAVNIARAIEKSKEQSLVISQEKENVYKFKATNEHSSKEKSSRNKSKIILCKFCGRNHEMVRSACPAFGKKCNKCSKPNHFAQQCKTIDCEIHEAVEDEVSDTSEIDEAQYQIL